MKYETNVRETGGLLEGLSSEAWMGFIFYPPSPRSVDEETLSETLEALPRGVKKVGVFVNEDPSAIKEKIQLYGLDIIQLHGEETPEQVREIGALCTVIKALPIATSRDLIQTAIYQDADYLLFDTKGPNKGGNGIPFDWSVLGHYKGATPFILSGGIGPETSKMLEGFAHPRWAGIDVNSRFEIRPGLKDIHLLESFFQTAK